MHVFSVCKDARVKQSMIASSKISLLKAAFDELTITKITRKVNAPNIRRLKSARPVIVNSSNARDLRNGDHACLTRASTGKLIIRTNEMTRLYKSDNYTKITPN